MNMLNLELENFDNIKNIWLVVGELAKKDKCNECDENGMVISKNSLGYNYCICNCRKDMCLRYPAKGYLEEVTIKDFLVDKLKVEYTYLLPNFDNTWGETVELIIDSLEHTDLNRLYDLWEDYTLGFINENDCKKICEYLTQKENDLTDEEMKKYYFKETK